MNQEQVLEQCRRCGAMLEGHFQLSSGRHSDRYFQCALLLSDPLRAESLARAVALKVEESADVVLGPALGAVVWTHEIARALGLRAMFAERSGGAMALRRGFRLEPGERVLLAEDVLTTGGSVREVLELVRAAGARPVGVVTIVNRSGRRNPFEEENLSFATLAEVAAQSWSAEQCPLCATGRAGPAVKPGSRPVAEAEGAAEPARIRPGNGI